MKCKIFKPSLKMILEGISWLKGTATFLGSKRDHGDPISSIGHVFDPCVAITSRPNTLLKVMEDAPVNEYISFYFLNGLIGAEVSYRSLIH